MAQGYSMDARVSPEVATSRDRLAADTVTTSVTPDVFSKKLGQFSEALIDGLETVNDRTAQYALDAVELHVELTSKGEVRLIAAAGAEVRGAIKLTFRARRPPIESPLADPVSAPLSERAS